MSDFSQEQLSHIIKTGEQTIRDQQSEIKKLGQARDWLADRAANGELYKEAVELTLDLVRGGVVSIDSFETKVAEFVQKGEHGIEVAREAHKLIAHEKGASFGIVESEEQGADVDAESGNEALEYLAEFATNHEA